MYAIVQAFYAFQTNKIVELKAINDDRPKPAMTGIEMEKFIRSVRAADFEVDAGLAVDAASTMPEG